MLGALIGDIAGSRFEWKNCKKKDGFQLFHERCRATDDSMMTLAIAKAILDSGNGYGNLEDQAIYWMQLIGRKYPNRGYGGMFRRWLVTENPQPYNSFGNGAAMRVSPCGFAASSMEEAAVLANHVTRVTHNHPEGLKGAEAISAAIVLARQGKTIPEIREYITAHYYALDFTLDSIRQHYVFDVTCQGSVPQAIEAFLESTDFEDAIRNAISIGGDSDTIAAMAGGIAEAYYGVPEDLREKALSYLDSWQQHILFEFEERFPGNPLR